MITINKDKCFVDKRRLVLECTVEGYFFGDDTKAKHFVFTADGWNDEIVTLSIDGKEYSNKGFKVLNFYKHCIQVAIEADGDNTIFIDRRYMHNDSYDVYYAGQHYLVGKENI